MGESLRILIVEDNPGDALLETEQLKGEGLVFEYRRVETEEDFLREMDAFKPDIVLADYCLPRFDGLKALRIAHQKYPFIPLIIVSGVLDEEAAISLLKEGAVDYILKQSIARLGSAVKNALERRWAQEEQVHAEEYRAVVQGLNAIIVRMSTDGKVEFINRFGLEFFGFTEEEVVGKPIVDTILPRRESTGRDLEAMKDDILRFPGRYYQNENENVRKNGERVWVSWTNNALKDRTGKISGILASGIDITYRKRMEDTLRRNEYELKTLVDSSPDIIVRLSRDLRYRFVNPAYERITGIPREQFIGKTNAELGMPEDQAAHWEEELRNVFDSGREGSIELAFRGFFGERYFWGRIVPEFAKSGLVETALVIARDITERRRAEEQIRYISFHDPVTGLYNRAYYEEEMRRVDTERSLPVSIIMGDVNNLKLTNDTFGHDEGDRLLQRVASVLRVSCRQTDIVARWGGDEFVVILPNTPLPVSEGIIRRIGEESAKAKDLSLPLSIALGVSTKENTEQNIYQVLREAEERMYETKALFGRQNRKRVFAALLGKLFERQPSLKDHIGRLKELIGRMTEPLRLSRTDTELLSMVCDLHEVGKVAVSDSIWLKRGRLEAGEWDAMKKYIDISYLVARTFSEFAPCADILQSLDERWDGYGYPRGLQDGAIPYLSRVFALCDAFDVMTHERPYAATFSVDDTLAELQRCSGKQFDPGLTDKFVAAIRPPEPVR